MSTAAPCVLVVGAGFAGFNAAREAKARLGDGAEVVLLNATDHFLYLPLLPEVAVGLLEVRRICTPLSASLHGVRVVLGSLTGLDAGARRVRYSDPEGDVGTLDYDRLVLAMGSVNKLLPIPGLAEHGHGFRGTAEALYLRDHITGQIELAAGATDPQERRARCTFVVVGAGYTGTEVVAQGQLLTRTLAAQHSAADLPIRWLLLDTADRVLPGLDRRLSKIADRVLRRRGVEVRLGESVSEVTASDVALTSGGRLPTRTLIWCVGVTPDPLNSSLGLPTDHGRLVVDERLAVRGHPEILGCGDAAAVPDPARPGQPTAMTAQHAQRQGVLAGKNVAASLQAGTDGAATQPYTHHDLGFVVDLGGTKAAANPLGVPISGIAAKAITRGYHLVAMPANRLRIAVDWVLNALQQRTVSSLGLVGAEEVSLQSSGPADPGGTSDAPSPAGAPDRAA